MVDVLDDLFGLPVTSGVVGVLEGGNFAPGGALGRPHHPLRLRAVQLPYQAVIQPDRMLSIVHLNPTDTVSKQYTFCFLH